MHASEKMPGRYQERWQDAWEADGAEVTLSGTWCHDWMDTSHPSVQAWRFDRCFFLSRAFRRAVPEDEGATFLSATQQPPGASLLSASESQPGDRPVPTEVGAAANRTARPGQLSTCLGSRHVRPCLHQQPLSCPGRRRFGKYAASRVLARGAARPGKQSGTPSGRT